MAKYELSIDVNYVKDWGVAEAVREIFQNSVDEERVNPENKSFFGYDAEARTLTIGNKQSCLDVESLLLGVSTKTSNDDTIGQFGEGYKIATVVLLRTKHPITFYNYGKREVWKPRLVKSKRYNGRLIPTFFVDKEFPWTTVPDNDLTIVIENVTSEEYDSINEMILQLHTDIGRTYTDSRENKVLLEPKYSGKIYVNGLYVCTESNFNYGYDIQPKYLKLERDRKTVDGFDLRWATSCIWRDLMTTPEFKKMLFSKNYSDILYVLSTGASKPEGYDSWFEEQWGDKIPCNTQFDYDDIISRGGNPVVVSDLVCRFYSDKYQNFMSNTTAVNSKKEKFTKWFEKLSDTVSVPEDLETQFFKLVDSLND